MKKYKISREDLGRSFEEFYHCKFIPYSEKYRIPDNLLKNLKKEYLLREIWVPLEKKDGVIHVIVDDPNNILKRDMIENLLKTKSVRYDVALPKTSSNSSTISTRLSRTSIPSPISSASSTSTS